MRIASWNVNSIKQRIDNLTAWLRERSPDIVCLQEVRRFHHGEARHFSRTSFGHWAWPELPQAEFPAPEGYEVELIQRG